MKVLYIGVYKDDTGWSHAAIQNILALDSVDIDVVPRHVKLNGVNGEYPDRIKELERKSAEGCDIVIQNVLPHHMIYDGNFKRNIACYYTETSHFRNTSWPERLNLMDEGWVTCNDMLSSARESFVKIPLHVFPVPCDVSQYQRSYEPYPIPNLEGNFVFYTIGEVSKRKNLIATLRAFHAEFHPHEPVRLLIKGNIPGNSDSQTHRHIKEMCDNVKRNLKLYPDTESYHEEIILSQHLSNEQIMKLHSTCDCFVMPSHGEGWNIPSFDAMALGKTPIVTKTGPMKEFVTEDCGYLVECRKAPVFAATDGLNDVCVGNEEWDEIDILDLRRKMRLAFTDRKDKQRRAENGMKRAYEYSHQNVGVKMKELLHG